MKNIDIILTLILIVAIGSFLRFYRLGAKDLWFDEVYEAYLAKGASSVTELVSVHSKNVFDNNPPASHILRYISYKAGQGEYYIRLPSAIFGVCTIIMTFIFARYLFDSIVGLIGALLISISYFHIYYSQEARSYTLYTFLSLLSIYLLCIISSGSAGKWIWTIYTTAISLLMYTHYYSFLIIGLQIIILLSIYFCKNRGKMEQLPSVVLKQYAFSLSIAALLFLPWVPTFIYHFTRVRGVVFYSGETIIHNLSYTISELIGAHTMGTYAYLLFFLAGCIVCAKKDISKAAILIVWSVMPFPFAIVIFILTKHFGPRYFIFILPVFFTAVALGVRETLPFIQKFLHNNGKTKGRLIYFSLCTVLFLLFVNISGLKRYYTTQKWPLSDIVMYLSAEAEPEDIVIAETYLKPPLLYYMAEKEIYDDPVYLSIGKKRIIVSSNDIIDDLDSLWKKRRMWYISDKKALPNWVRDHMVKAKAFKGLVSNITVYKNRP